MDPSRLYREPFASLFFWAIRRRPGLSSQTLSRTPLIVVFGDPWGALGFNSISLPLRMNKRIYFASSLDRLSASMYF